MVGVQELTSQLTFSFTAIFMKAFPRPLLSFAFVENLTFLSSIFGSSNSVVYILIQCNEFS